MKLRSQLTIGRDAVCDVRLEDDTVSRQHARVSATGDGRLRIEDLASSNGTWRQEQGRWRAVHDESLAPDARVRFGEHEVVLAEALAAWSGLWLTGVPDDLPVQELHLTPALPEDPELERPRRNPATGNIEESA